MEKEKIIVAFLVLSILVSCGDGNNLSMSRLNSPPEFPEWLEPIETEVEESLFAEYSAARSNFENVKLALRKYNYLLSASKTSDRVPFWLYMSSKFFLSLDYDHLAYNMAQKLIDLSDAAACTGEWTSMKDLAAYKHEARLIHMIILARNNLNNNFSNLMKEIKLSKSSDYARAATGYMLLGDHGKSLKMLAKSLLDQNLERPHKKSSYTAGAVAMAFGMGEFEKVKDFSSWMIDEGRESKKYIPPDDTYGFYKNQWLSCYDIVFKFRTMMEKDIKFEGLKDGNYTSSVRGFLDLIDVSMEVVDGKIENITAINGKDDRPFTVFDIIPQRILSRQSIMVDAVTTATISSSAVLAAAADTLIQAGQ